LNEAHTASVVVAEYLAEGYPSAMGVVIPVEGNPITQYVVDHKVPLSVEDAQHDPRMTPIHDLMRRRGTVSLLILPLIVRGNVVGTLGLDAVERRKFNQEEIDLASSAVSSAAQVLENARLFEAERQTRQVSEALVGIARELNTVSDLDTAFDLVLSQMERVITSDSSAILLRQNGHMVVSAVRGFSDPEGVLNKRLDLKIAELNREVVETQRPLIVASVSNDQRWIKSVKASGLTPNLRDIHSWMGVPLIVQERVIGMLTLDKVEPDFYQPEDAELALAFASHAAIAIEKTRLFDEAMARNTDLLNIYQAAQRLQRIHTPEDLAREIIFTIEQTLGYQYAAILLIDPPTGLLEPFVLSDQGLGNEFMEEDKAYIASHNIRLGEGITGWVAKSGESVCLGDVGQDPRYYPMRPEIRSELCVPLKVRDKIIGVVNIESTRPDAFRESDQHLLETLASQIAISIQNAQLQNETQRRLAYLQSLHKIDEAISGSLDLRLMLRVLLDQVVNQLKVDAADVLLLRKETQDLEYAAGLGFRMNYNPPVQRINQSPAGNAVMERRIIHIANLKKLVTGFLLSPALRGEGFASYYGVPLIAKGQVLGVLEIFNRAPLGSEPEWLDFLVTIAGQAAIAIENATMFDDLQRSNLAIRMAYESTLEGWARTLELRDMETEGHSRRVVDMTMQLAQRMNLRGSDLTHLRWGALLHDIGKMGIPDSILQKPGPLTPEEWALMKKHPVFAYDLLYPVEYLRTALDIPYCHHERWDGSGYPRGLTGEQIPLAARIFAVVDVWDALTSNRPYREAWSIEKAAAYLRENAGTHFDPQVVRAFFDAGMNK
jgi:GAF domain-containing protein